MRGGITPLCCFSLNTDQSSLTYLHEWEAFEALSIYLPGHMVKIVKVIILLATGFFLLGFAVALRPLMQEGFWPGFAGILICLGVMLIGTGTASQIARTPKRNRNRFFDKIGWVFVEPFGWLSLGLVGLSGRYSFFLGVAVFLCCGLFAVLMFRRFCQADEDENSRAN